MSVLEDILGNFTSSPPTISAAWSPLIDLLSPVPTQEAASSPSPIPLRIAAEVGLSEDQTADLLAKALPMAVDQASPDGNEPAADRVESTLKG